MLRMKVSTETPNDEIVAVRAIDAKSVNQSLAGGGIDELANSKQGIAARNGKNIGDLRIGGGGVDFFIGITELDVVITLDGGEKRFTAKRRVEKPWKILGGEVASFEGERFVGGV